MTIMMIPYPFLQYQAAGSRSTGRNHSLRMINIMIIMIIVHTGCICPNCKIRLSILKPKYIFQSWILKISMMIVRSGPDLPLGLKLPTGSALHSHSLNTFPFHTSHAARCMLHIYVLHTTTARCMIHMVHCTVQLHIHMLHTTTERSTCWFLHS